MAPVPPYGQALGRLDPREQVLEFARELIGVRAALQPLPAVGRETVPPASASGTASRSTTCRSRSPTARSLASGAERSREDRDRDVRPGTACHRYAELNPPEWNNAGQSQRLNGRRPKVPATLQVTHKTIGTEVRRGTFDIVVDGKNAGSVELNRTFEKLVQPGHHTLQIRNGRNSSRTVAFDAAEDQVVAFRCGGKRFLPLFLLSFAVPSLAIVLKREY